MIPKVETLAKFSVLAEQASYGAWCDRMAVNNRGVLMLVSVCGPGRIIAGIGGALSAHGWKGTLRIGQAASFLGEEQHNWKGELARRERSYDEVYREESAYRRLTWRLEYDTVQAIYIAKVPGLLLNASDASVGRALRDPDVCTTPVLPAWVPHIAREMRTQKLITDLDCFQCRCALIKGGPATTKAIDAIVLKGGRSGALSIPN